MPIAKFQLPDGRVGRFEVPEGTSPEQAMQLISTNLSSLLPKPQERPPLEGASETPLAAPNVMTAEQYQNDVEKRAQEPSSRSASDYVKDAGITFLKGAIGLPESFVGLADIPTRGEVGKLLAQAGYKPAEAKSILDTYLSEAQQAANRKVSEAKGFFPTIGASLQNPSTIATSVGESLPQMIGGAGIARGAIKAAPAMAPYLAGALGEGVLGAGSAAEQMRQESDTGLLTGKQSAAAIGSGIGTGIFGLAAGKLADKLGLDNVNTMLAGRAAKGEIGSVKDFVKQAAASGVTEGLFEELPQSAQEQMWMNYAQDKPLLDGVAEAAASGLVAGVAMGTAGTAIGRKAYTPQENAVSATPPQVKPQFEVAPTQSKPPIEETAPQVAPKAEEPIDENAPSQDQEEMMQELGLAPKKEQVPIVSPELGGGASHVLPPKVEVTHAYPMGENTEYQVLRTPTGYVANLFDKDAGKYVLGSARAYPIQTFGADAEIKANEFAQEQMHKAAKFNPITPTVAPETTKETPLLEAPKAKETTAPAPLLPKAEEPKAEEPNTQKPEIETEIDPQERLRRANVSIFNAKRMLSNGQITQAQYDELQKQYTTIKAKASRIGEGEKTFAPAVATKGEYKETKSLDTFFASHKDDKKRLDTLDKYGQPEVKQAVTNVNTALQKVTDAINAAGYSSGERKHQVPAELRPLFDQYSQLTGGASRLLMESERVGNNKKLASQEKLAKAIEGSKADVENAYKVLGFQPEAAPVAKVEPKIGVSKSAVTPAPILNKISKASTEAINTANDYIQKLSELMPAAKNKDAHQVAIDQLNNTSEAINEKGQIVADEMARTNKKSPGQQNRDIQAAQKDLNKALIEHRKAVLAAKKLTEPKAKTVKTPVARPELTKPPEPEEIVKANEDIEYAQKETRRTKKLSRSLWSALKGKLTSSNVSNLGKGYEPLKAGRAETPTDISTMVADGALDDFLPYHMRHDSDIFEEQESVEYIYDKLLNKNYITFAADLEIKQLMGSVEEAEDLIHEYFKLKEINELIDQAADEQREAEINARVLEPEGETRAAPTGAPELTLQGETPEEVRAKEKEKEDREKAEKEAEAKAKADEGVAEFTLTGSNRPADLAAAKGQESLFGESSEQKALAEVKKGLVRFASGMSGLSDLETGSRARSGHLNYGVGVDVGLLSNNAIDSIANAVLNSRVPIFIDSGAFSNFRQNLKGNGPKPLDFNKILAKYDQITEAIQNQNEEERTDYPRPIIVMPDVVGDQAASLELIKQHKNWIIPELKFNVTQPMIPIQKGELTLSQVYDELVKTLGTDDFIVGVPSQAEAVSRSELTEFLRESQPKKIHFLGAASDKKLTPLLNIVATESPDTKVTADASKVRSAILDGVAQGKTREQAIMDALMEEEDPGVLLDKFGPQLTDESNVIDGTDLIREIGKEKQLELIADQSKNLTDKETAVLEEEYGAKSGTDEFLQRLHDDVSNFITKGANSVKNKIRGIINKIANSLLSVAVAFNMNYVSAPVNVVVPAYTTTVQEVIQEAPEEAAKDMSPQARRAYEVLYPSLKDELIKENKLFLVTDKPTAMQFIFNPDGTLLMKSKVLLAKGIGDFEKGNNNIDANKITPAGVRTLVKRFHTTSTEGYDFDTVFGTMGTDEKTGGKYFSTVYHSVYTHLPDAQKRLQALQEPGAANSRYSFGCINVDKSTFGKLVKEHGDQMDGATLFVVPDNDKNVMNFINGQATEAKDIVRRKVEPALKEERVPVKEASKIEGQKLAGREQEFGLGYPVMMTPEERKEMIGNYAKLRAMIARIYRKAKVGKFGLGEQMNVTSLEELAADYKKAIRSTQLPRTAPGKFFARASEAYAAGDITKDVFDVVVDAYRKFPELIDGLALSILKRPEGSASAGQFSSFGDLVALYKKTEGVDDPKVIRHELTHSLEKMMTPQAQENLFDAWKRDFKKAQQKYTSTAEKTFFESVIKFFNDPTPLMHQAMMEAYQETGNIDLYQYMTPSEYWAMNAEKLMERRLGSGWDKFVNAIARLFEGLKNILGFNNKYAVHKVFKQVMAGSKERKNDTLLTTATGTNYRLNMPSQRYNYKGQPAPAASFDSPTDTKMDDILRHIQDKHIDTKRLVQELEKDGKKIGEEWNPYVKEELYHGRTASKIKTFLDDELVPLVKEMGEHKVTLADFDEYLYMRHAEERNEQIASINPTYSDVDLTPGSGKSTSEAKKYLNNLPADKRKVFESLAAKVDAIIKGTQDALIDGGLETKDTINDWNKTYKHYVPLQRNEEELDFVHHGSGLGQGMSTKGGASRRAFGSLKSVVDVFSNIALQRERAIIRSEKAVVGKALYGLALQNPNPDFWLAVNPDAIKNKKKLYEELTALGLTPAVASNIIQEPKVATIDSLTGLVRYEVNPVLRSSDNVFPVRINGKDRYVFFNNKDERAKNIVKAMKNLDSEQLGYVFGMAGDMTRWIAAVNTQYNPVFGAWNFLRDVGGATFNLSTTPIADKKWQVNKNVFPAMFAIYGDLRGNRKGIKGNEEMQKWHQSFLGAGGATGYSEQFSRGRSKINGEKLETIVEKELGKLNRGNVSKAAHVVFDWLSDYNDAMENAVRLSAFKVYLENNMSKAEINALLNGGNITLDMQRHIDKAASIAKNLTVNFNRKGSASQLYQSLFAFFNASVQGTARLAETLKGPAGRKIMAGGFALGAIQAIALAMAGYDDDEPPEYLKNKNLIIPLGDTYLIAPLPLGLNIFPGIGRIATEYVLGKMGFITGAKGGASKVGDVLALALDTFNPLGGGSLAQMMTPTIADPIIALSSNKDAFGRPISKEDMSSHPTPGYLRSRENANVIAQGISEFLNYASGGNEDVKGGFSPTADQISYFAGQYTGGVGRELMKGVDLGSSLFTGEPLPSYRVPIVGKMYGETSSPSAIQDKFYKNVVLMSEHEDSLKGRLKRHEDRQEYMQEHPEARLWKMANSIENQISALNKQRKQLIESGAPDSKIENNRERKTHLMEKFNDKVKELQSD